MKKYLFIFSFSFISLYSNVFGQNDTTCVMPDNNMIDKAIQSLWAGSCFCVDTDRLHALNIIQCAANHLTHTQYNSYLKAENNDWEKETGILRFYQQAFEKIIDEAKTETPANGTIIMWYLYNMGYIIKTPACCFGIDIKHKNSEQLVDIIDFLLITHRHDDHFDNEMVEAMNRSGKPVVSNFFNNDYLITQPKTMTIGEVTIKILINDHNVRTPNFVLSFEIDCGKSTDHMNIFHTGDSYLASQLLTSNEVDIFIPHVRVGLDINEAAKNIHAKNVMMSHVLELGHTREEGGYRWSFENGFDECNKMTNASCYLPVWGEKIHFNKKLTSIGSSLELR